MKVCIFMLNNKKCKLGEKECPGYQNCNKCSAVIDMEQIRKDDKQYFHFNYKGGRYV